MTYTFGFLGCGNMGGALAQAAAKAIPADRLAVCDADPSKTAELTRRRQATAADAQTVARESEYLFLAVKPQGLAALFEQIRPVLSARTDGFVLVSMAAGVSLADLRALAGFDCPVIRMMPNTPVGVGQGMILYAANEQVTSPMLEGFLGGLSHAGRFDCIPERLIDAAGAISGCGPAFVYLFAEALADGGVACGLPRDKAQMYAAQTLLGSAQMLLESGRHPGQLKDAVCSPGGTTIAGVRALEDAAFRAAAMNAVLAAYEKTAKLRP